MKLAQFMVRLNGTTITQWSHDMRTNWGGSIGFGVPFLLDLSAADYLEIWGMMQATGTCKWYSEAVYRASFGGFKLL
jgi:hypothetical protein